ncbi:hypothetical protein ASE98_18910 [Pseudomonas sp. Leaf48]|nr:hypothetical protein ASE98_18910 [Pseudomonas sp. Leaf48]
MLLKNTLTAAALRLRINDSETRHDALRSSVILEWLLGLGGLRRFLCSAPCHRWFPGDLTLGLLWSRLASDKAGKSSIIGD